MGKTIQQIKDCQAIDLGYNSFRGLVINPKKDMALDHINLCIERSMKEFASQHVNESIELLKDLRYHLDAENRDNVQSFIEELNLKLS